MSTALPPTVQLFAVIPAGALQLPTPPGATGIRNAFEGLPKGVYSALRTYGGVRFLRLEDHLDRTQQSIDLMGWEWQLDRDELRRALDEVAGRTPGEKRLRFDFLPEPVEELGTDSRVLIASEPLAEVPGLLLERGVEIQVARGLTRYEPIVKKSSFIERREPLPLGTPEAYEHLLLDGAGNILECSSSNFFLVQGGELRTAGEEVLEGITRRIVLELAGEAGLPVRQETLPFGALAEADEAFLTSSGRQIVPVVRVEGRDIGPGSPGPVTRGLIEAYGAYVERAAQTAV